MIILYASGNDQQRRIYRLYMENLFPDATVYEISGLTGLKDACEWILSPDMVFVSDDLQDGTARDILDYAANSFAKTKFVLIGDSYPTNFPDPEEFDSLNSDFLPLQLTFPQFTAKLSRITGSDLEIRELYRHIPLVSFYRYNQVLCDTYVKLSDDKYVKIQKAGATYSRDDLDKYRHKGIAHLYIKDDDFQKYAVSFSNLSFLKGPAEYAKLSEEEMLLRLSDVHMQINDIAKEVGISKDAIALAEENCKNIIFFISDHPGLEALFVRKATLEDYLYDHSYLTSIVCAEIFSKIGHGNMEGIKKLCQASIMHDITIKNPKLSLVKGQNDPRMMEFTKEEVKNYLKHPTLTANLLESSGIFSQDVADIVRYHHITPEGGFPEKIHPSRLNLLTSVFIMAHEFVSKLYDNDFDKTKIEKIILEMVIRFREPNFRKALSGFDAAKEFLALDEVA